MAKKRRKNQRQSKKMNIDVAVVALFIIGILSAAFIYFKSGYIGETLSKFLGGIFGFVKYIIPIGIIAVAINIIKEDKKYLTSKLMHYSVVVCCICTVMSIYEVAITKSLCMNSSIQDVVERAYYLGSNNKGGGIIGAIISFPLIKLLGIPGTIIVTIGLALIFAIFTFGIRPTEIIANIIGKNKQEDDLEGNDKSSSTADKPEKAET